MTDRQTQTSMTVRHRQFDQKRRDEKTRQDMTPMPTRRYEGQRETSDMPIRQQKGYRDERYADKTAKKDRERRATCRYDSTKDRETGDMPIRQQKGHRETSDMPIRQCKGQTDKRHAGRTVQRTKTRDMSMRQYRGQRDERHTNKRVQRRDRRATRRRAACL